MPENAKKPQIRFKGFTDDWEQRKLGEESTDIVAGGDINKLLICNKGQYPVIANALNDDGIIGYYANQYRIKAPAVTITGRGEVGFAKARTVNFTPVVRLLSVKSNHDVFYLENAINTLKIMIESTGVPQLTVPQIAKYEIYFPNNLKEEQLIGNLFCKLDYLIALHQRKLDKLKNVKKSMLEKMFPKNGSTVPEIRFKGFTDAWEQRKLNEFTDKVIEKNIGLQYLETFTNSAEFGIISQKDFFDHSISKIDSLEGYYVVKNNDFVYNPRISTTAPVGPINRNKLGRTGVMSPLYTVFEANNVNYTFLEYFFKTNKWHPFMILNGDTGARSDRFSIKDDLFFEMPICRPKIDEQIKIGKYLTKFDNLITLHQRKLEKLQNIKKACLEKMFV